MLRKDSGKEVWHYLSFLGPTKYGHLTANALYISAESLFPKPYLPVLFHKKLTLTLVKRAHPTQAYIHSYGRLY